MEENPDGVLLKHGDVITFGRCKSFVSLCCNCFSFLLGEKKYKYVDKKEEARANAAVQMFGEPSAAQLNRDKFDEQ